MSRIPPIKPGLVLWDTATEQFGMVIKRYYHLQHQQEVVEILWQSGEESGMFLSWFKDDGCEIDFAGRLKLESTSRFANGKNYRWLAVYNNGFQAVTLSVLQSIRHDHELATAPAAEKHLAAWKAKFAHKVPQVEP
ncbi:hypothetical protein [Deinococcus wulumuqiensis]|uniref:SRPBCC domain-containing protein n=1 Tax=Deinococcus wulumuqiensis TaxID=980427 RepID=A0AAV4K960_9DEIO|nr:hypothetical protein [Deinococcus wulumuqiensis]QII20079.1 hypothetical protein G6R31_04335 [Deinococcus wulumuqiensis R12]GGI87456.1 hypothetical protein GCM10010914_22410 [Deinococcus wulumuqiensis]GGP30014.1 hypothetical protein GCM10008021_16650 [Deinococcus wulumuqiensis]